MRHKKTEKTLLVLMLVTHIVTMFVSFVSWIMFQETVPFPTRKDYTIWCLEVIAPAIIDAIASGIILHYFAKQHSLKALCRVNFSGSVLTLICLFLTVKDTVFELISGNSASTFDTVFIILGYSIVFEKALVIVSPLLISKRKQTHNNHP